VPEEGQLLLVQDLRFGAAQHDEPLQLFQRRLRQIKRHRHRRAVKSSEKVNFEGPESPYWSEVRLQTLEYRYTLLKVLSHLIRSAKCGFDTKINRYRYVKNFFIFHPFSNAS